MKKCLGCGTILQTEDKNASGYTPKLTNDLCMRCFKLKHYGHLTSAGKKQENIRLLKQINQIKGYVIFLVDFLNIYDEVIETYKKIDNPKCLVITKCDLIPKNLQQDKLVKNIKRNYNIKEDVILISSKRKENLSKIVDICFENKKIVFAGFTNAGKSSVINALIKSDLTVSSTVNTTQEFIELNAFGVTIYDAPGFINVNYCDDVPKNIIRPISYQLANKYYLKINNINIASQEDNNVTLYLNNQLDISKRRIKEPLSYQEVIPAKHDLVIKGLGFIYFSKKTKLSINIHRDFYEIRPTIIGGNNE